MDVGVPSESLMRPSPHHLACCISSCHSDPSRSTLLQAAAGLSFGGKCISEGPEVGRSPTMWIARTRKWAAHLPTCDARAGLEARDEALWLAGDGPLLALAMNSKSGLRP